jgi:hypothetical protein
MYGYNKSYSMYETKTMQIKTEKQGGIYEQIRNCVTKPCQNRYGRTL